MKVNSWVKPMDPTSRGPENETAKPPRLSGRQDSYDLVKGFLVEVMIIYHSVAYFGGSEEFLKYIDFVTGAFVFLSGSTVTHYYLKEYRERMSLMLQRLLIRSTKLIILFTIINTCVHLVVKKNYNGVNLGIQYFYSNLYEVFILGSRRIAAFEILLPIAYTLAAGGILVLLVRSKVLLATVVCVVFALSFYIEFYIVDLPFNLEFLNVGLGGVIYGCFRQESLHENARRLLALLTGVTVAAYMTTVTVIDRDNLMIYFVGVASVVQAISMVAEKRIYVNCFAPALKLFGRYSLFSYLLQILLLQCLFRLIGREASGVVSITGAILITNVFLYFIVRGISLLRGRHQLVRVAYQIAFA